MKFLYGWEEENKKIYSTGVRKIELNSKRMDEHTDCLHQKSAGKVIVKACFENGFILPFAVNLETVT